MNRLLLLVRMTALSALLSLYAAPADADLVRLKNGESFEGALTEETDTHVVYKLEDKSVRIKRSSVDWTIPGERSKIEQEAETGNNFLEGTRLAKFGDYQKAVELLEKTLKARPDDPAVQANLAYAYALSGSPDKAVELYRKAAKLDPDNPQFRQNLITALFYNGQFLEVAHLLHRDLRKEPASVDLHKKLGLVFHKAGIYTQSVRYAHKISELASIAKKP